MSEYNRLDSVALDKWIEGDPEFDMIEDQYTACHRPGKNGCGLCDACSDWEDTMLSRHGDRYEERY